MTVDLLFMSAVKATALIRSRKLSPVEYLDAVLDAIDRVNPRLNCFRVVLVEEARRDAMKAEEAVARGKALGPLHGVPVSIKDLIDVKGVHTRHGSAIFEDNVEALTTLDGGFGPLSEDFVGMQVSAVRAAPEIAVHPGLARFLEERDAWTLTDNALCFMAAAVAQSGGGAAAGDRGDGIRCPLPGADSSDRPDGPQGTEQHARGIGARPRQPMGHRQRLRRPQGRAPRPRDDRGLRSVRRVRA